jgi:hypothetical protein
MMKPAGPRWAWLILAACLAVAVLACGPKAGLRPQVQTSPSQFPFFVNSRGLAIAVVPFDGRRDVFSDPADPRIAKPDFDWLKAGVRPTRIILTNESQQAVWLDPSQVTAVDVRGVTYRAYKPGEAADAVIASEAFGAHLRRGLRGALAGAALGAGVGAALGSVSPYGGSAAAGAAWGGAMGGLQGLIVGTAGSRADLEGRVRRLMETRQLPETLISPGMTRDGLVFFPNMPMQAVRLVLAVPDRQASWTATVEVSLPPGVASAP